RPRSTVPASETGNLEGDEVAVEFARAGRHRGASACAFYKPHRIGRNVEDKPMSKRAWKIKLWRQIRIRHADCEAFCSRWRSRPCETGRRLVLFRKTVRDV